MRNNLKLFVNMILQLLLVLLLFTKFVFFRSEDIDFEADPEMNIGFLYIENGELQVKHQKEPIPNIYKIVRIRSGLGNQLFMYAFSVVIAKEIGYPVYLDLSSFEECNMVDDCFESNVTFPNNINIRRFGLKYFNISNHNISDKRIISRAEHIADDEEIFNNGVEFYKDGLITFFKGYYEDLGFFDFVKYRSIFVNEFKLKNKMDPYNEKLLKMIKETNSVSIHIRRTDKKLTGYLSLNYYKDAINYLMKRVDNPHFFIFSDDIQWTKDNLNIDAPHIYIENDDNHNYCDFELMKNCKYNIIANSTFSWWAAWLNSFIDKIVIAPKFWGRGQKRDHEGLIPDSFVRF